MECKKCGKNKEEKEFYFRNDIGKYRKECKECFNKTKRKHRKENIEKYREYDKKRYYEGNRKELIYEWREKNRDKWNKTRRECRQENIEKYREYDRKRNRKKYYKDRYKNNALFKLRRIISVSFSNHIKNKTDSTFKLTGFTKEEYLFEIKRKFKLDNPDENFEECFFSGNYQIDHIIPVSLVKNEIDIKKLYHPKNLRLIMTEENLYKQDKIMEKLIMKYNLSELFEEIKKEE
jgi:hypothetical protein